LHLLGIQNATKAQKRPNTVGDVFTSPVFGNVVISLLMLLGAHVAASIVFFDPWHIIVSFIQYLLIAPSYTTVLAAHAFANIHAFVVMSNNREEIEVAVPTPETDLMLHTMMLSVFFQPNRQRLISNYPQRDDKRTTSEDTESKKKKNLAWTLSDVSLLG